MPKAKLVTRSETVSTVLDDTLNKASALTHAEMDSNLINLRDSSWGLADDTSTVLQVTADKTIAIRGTSGISTALSGDTLTISGSTANIFKTIAVAGQSNIEADANTDTLTIAAGTNITLTTDPTTDTLTISGPSLTSYLTDIVNDTTPQLGGSLDVNGQTIVSTSNGNIELAPNGTGDVYLTADTVRVGDSNTDATITTNGTGDLILNTNSGTNSGTITIFDAANSNITITPNGTGKAIMGPAMTSTNFPYTIYNSSNTIPQWDSASYRGNQMVHSNLSVADITTFDGAHRANSRTLYGKADSSTTTYNSTTFRFQNTDNTIFDLNGATAGSTLTGNRGAGIRSIGAATVLTNSGGGTKTSPNLLSVTGFIQVDEGHGGTLTVTNAMGMRSSLSVRGNSTDTTTITNGYAYVADNTIGGGGAGTAAGTNYKVTNMYGFADMPTSTASIETTHYGFYMNSGAGAGTKYFLYTADDTHLSRLGTVERYNEKINSLTSSSTITVDADLAPVHKVTLGVNTQFGIANLSTGQTVTIIIVQDATGSRTASFTSDTSTAVKFAGGTSTLSTAANSIDIVTIFNDGTNFYGNIAKAYA